VPAVPRSAWLAGLLSLSLILLLGGGYNRVERLAMFKVAFFTLLTFLCALLLTRMPQYFSWDRVADGLRFQLPADGVTTALAVFGITGVGATELFMYPYWCVEKGYARFAGRRDTSDAWRARANGWVRVMHIDVLVSMAIYTLATMAFYLLGAGILHGMGLVPRGTDLIGVLSNVYTQTLGGWAIWLFYSSALVTLYGTVLAATAAHARCFADFCHMVGGFERHDYEARTRTRNRLIVAFAIVPVVLYWFFESPVKMVVFGGAVQAAMLPVIAASVLYLRHRRLAGELAPSTAATVWLWLCSILLVFAVVYALVP
jgi:Mn2+/Fe2+ NRAMP family transporter